MKQSDLKEYYKVKAYFESLFKSAKNPAIDKPARMAQLAKLLGNPEQSFKIIHVTGTAGKGSVANMLQTGLSAAGYKTGLFTSPYLTAVTEKIKVDSRYIDLKSFLSLSKKVQAAISQMEKTKWGLPTYAEAHLALALLYFKKIKCDWVVLEGGVGGRTDAVNFIKAPQVAVITNINLDHTQTLGKTLKQIARHKAGIIKKGTSFYTSEQRPRLLQIFKQICRQKGAHFNSVGTTRQNYQEQNAELTAKVLIDLSVSPQNIKKALTIKLPGRFEMIQQGPRVVLDGAHNPAKIKSILLNLKKLKYKKLYLIIPVPFIPVLQKSLRLITPLAHRVYFTHQKTKLQPSRHLKFVKKVFKNSFKKSARIEIFVNPQLALKQALQKANKQDLVLVTGSFHLAGELRKYWFLEEYVVKTRRSF